MTNLLIPAAHACAGNYGFLLSYLAIALHYNHYIFLRIACHTDVSKVSQKWALLGWGLHSCTRAQWAKLY